MSREILVGRFIYIIASVIELNEIAIIYSEKAK